MAAKAIWRFCSDFACAFFRHCSLLVCFAVVDAPIPEALLFDGSNDLLSMLQLLLMFLPCARVGWIGAECFYSNRPKMREHVTRGKGACYLLHCSFLRWV